MRFTHKKKRKKDGNHREKLGSLLLIVKNPAWRGEVRQLGFSCIEGKGRGTKRARAREGKRSLPFLLFCSFFSVFFLFLLSVFFFKPACPSSRPS